MVAGLTLAIVAGGLLVGNALLSRDDDPPAAASTTTTADPKGEVEQAFRAFNTMVDRLEQAPDPDDPEIARVTTGVTRTNFERSLAKRKTDGVIVKIGPQARQTVRSTTVSGNTATMSVCFVDQSGTFDAATGAPRSPMQITANPSSVLLVREDGVWKVSRVRQVGESKPGASSCD